MTEKPPNFLFIMADQLTAFALPAYGHRIVKAPHIDRLAERGTVFENAYCNYPICASSRFSMLSGQLAMRIRAYDNGHEFPASIPTLPHYLRYVGYHTCLSGKMHFVGPDQLHGYDERLTTEIYPSAFRWVADWSAQDSVTSTSGLEGHQTISNTVVDAGICIRSLQIDFDEETAYQGTQKLYDLARDPQQHPFFLTVSFTHPHNPFDTTAEYWNRYRDEDIDLPSVPMLPDDKQDDHSRRLHRFFRTHECELTDDHIRSARHAYYGNVSYIDDKVGQLLDALDHTGLADNTIVILTADHGEMLGERGLWFKNQFFEWSMRVPLIIRDPRTQTAGRSGGLVSLVDLLPTVLDLASDGDPPEPVDRLDGASLVGLLAGDDPSWGDRVMGEYSADGSTAPCFMLRQGAHKFIYCETDRDLLYDLSRDPSELENVAADPAYAETARDMKREILSRWDPPRIREDIVANQKRHIFVRDVLESTGSPIS